jgi:hypothetical protein
MFYTLSIRKAGVCDSNLNVHILPPHIHIRTGQAEHNRQNRAGRTGQEEQGRTGQAEQDRKNKAEQDRQNRAGRTGSEKRMPTGSIMPHLSINKQFAYVGG